VKIYIPPQKQANILATIAIGNQYLADWETNAYPSWAKYCRNHGLGLIVFDRDLIEKESKFWKKPTWQKLLIAETLANSDLNVHNVCYVDTDILISPLAPDIFMNFDSNTIGLVSLRKRLPFSYEDVLRRLTFLRHNFYDSTYPLDSSLFMSLEQLYRYHGLAVQNDEACAGLIVFNVESHRDLMNRWFYKYDRNIQSITSGGDQTHVNFEIQNWGKVSWLDYRFQAIWAFEMAWKYPFLYEFVHRYNDNFVRSCIEASLYQNYFLHFAGSWHESQMWKLGGFFEGKERKQEIEAYRAYLSMPVTGTPRGTIKPNNNL
jgi:hypothetical protein